MMSQMMIQTYLLAAQNAGECEWVAGYGEGFMASGFSFSIGNTDGYEGRVSVEPTDEGFRYQIRSKGWIQDGRRIGEGQVECGPLSTLSQLKEMVEDETKTIKKIRKFNLKK